MRNTFLESVILQRAEEQLSSLDFRSSKGHSEATPLTRCECGEVIPRNKKGGRPRKYCDAECAADAKRRRATEQPNPERLERMREAKARQTQRKEAALPGLWRKRRAAAISKGLARRTAPTEAEVAKRERFNAKHPNYHREYARKRAEARRAIMEQS